MKKKEADFAIIGGGIVGLSVAHGLLKQGASVLCIDGTDTDFRASRGNFGLVWVQGKGIKSLSMQLGREIQLVIPQLRLGVI